MDKPHYVQLSEPAYTGFAERAAALGLTVDAYLNQIGAARPSPSGLVMTPEIIAGIERGLDDVRNGRVDSWDEVDARFVKQKHQWHSDQDKA